MTKSRRPRRWCRPAGKDDPGGRWPAYFAAVAGRSREERLVLGAMSGTSSDGVTVALVCTRGQALDRQVRLQAYRTVPYPRALRDLVFRLYPPNVFDGATLARAMVGVTEAFAAAVCELLEHAGTAAGSVHLLSVHGPTLYYEPPGPDNAGRGAFVELMEPSLLAELTGIPVLSDLRSADLAAGGLGAPLSAFADLVLFRHPERGRIIQNVGGIANPTVIGPGASWDTLLCFDTGPGNVLIDGVVSIITGGAEAFDRDGERAARGHVHEGLLAELMAHPYIHRPPPKTTGREVFGLPMARELVCKARALGLTDDDLVATVTAYTAESIAFQYRRFVFPRFPIHEVFLTGGGASNPTLRRMLAERLPGLEVKLLDQLGMPSEAREAVIWAVLGDESALGLPANVPSTSGASHPAILGKLAPGRRFSPGGSRP
ncbi:anhydro-N-acetylmuramic acid kinase [Carboxydochorda subterranea]|uniref:Anhydro-N-acetylmuramic acid kinase n=1 Tax=Carboxydichorda subterranea TaxID=3109565 RepID=A0ABZ1BVF6_9FIRM|nr:anhydro-N-acetylmuramic acid kinase [Limnochorda sp. L945t]WRP16759.1 anhydro-N-acetylmuramic acid kinase [Limnochorda sp. L945t]